MGRLRGVVFALVALVCVSSATVGLLAIGRSGVVSPIPQVDVAALTTEIQKQDAAFFGAFNAHDLAEAIAVHRSHLAEIDDDADATLVDQLFNRAQQAGRAVGDCHPPGGHIEDDDAIDGAFDDSAPGRHGGTGEG